MPRDGRRGTVSACWKYIVVVVVLIVLEIVSSGDSVCFKIRIYYC